MNYSAWTFLLVGCVLLILAADVARRILGRRRPHPLPGTQRSLEELRRQFFRVSAGRRLKPSAWPGGSRVAVGLSFDVDNATPPLSRS